MIGISKSPNTRQSATVPRQFLIIRIYTLELAGDAFEVLEAIGTRGVGHIVNAGGGLALEEVLGLIEFDLLNKVRWRDAR